MSEHIYHIFLYLTDDWINKTWSSHTMEYHSVASVLSLCDPMDHSPLDSMGFSGQKYWSGLPFPPPMEYYSAIKKMKDYYMLQHG